MPSQDEISPARKLVTVRCVDSVTPFNSAHSVLTIDGWTVAAKKTDGIFKKGEYVLYFEVDTFLPITSEAAPLFQKALGQTSVFQDKKGYRVGTRDIVNNSTPIKSVISQGLVFKLGLFPEIYYDFHCRRRNGLKLTDDFTDIMRNVDYSRDLGVVKWESKADPDTGNWTMPSFIKRTTTERVQNCPNLFIKQKYRTFVYQESVKLDGRSMTCVCICGPCPVLATDRPMLTVDSTSFTEAPMSTRPCTLWARTTRRMPSFPTGASVSAPSNARCVPLPFPPPNP